MTQNNRHKGRQQVLRAADEILERRRFGEPMLAIHGDLKERGDIDLAYRTFSRWVRRLETGEIAVGTSHRGPAMAQRGRDAAPFLGNRKPREGTSIQTMDELKPKKYLPRRKRS